MTLRCTTNQMQMLLDHVDSPYIRAIGFLYLRYIGDPKDVYSQWIEPYLYDEEPIAVTANAQKKSSSSVGYGHGGRGRHQQEPETIGDFVRKLFSDRDYYGTMLPRLPVHIERDIQVKLLLAEKIQQRAQKHLRNKDTMNDFQRIGAKVMALYGDEENPITWYEAIVDRVLTRNEETGQALNVPKFVVTFPEYGNTETVLLGEMEQKGVPLDPVSSSAPSSGGSDRGYDNRDSVRYDRDDHHHRGGGRGGGGGQDLYDEVRKREQDRVTASGRNAVAQRPLSAKASIAGPTRGGGGRRGYEDDGRDYGRRNDDRVERSAGQNQPSGNATTNESSAASSSVAPPPSVPEKKRSAEEMAAVEEKKRKLMAKYG